MNASITTTNAQDDGGDSHNNSDDDIMALLNAPVIPKKKSKTYSHKSKMKKVSWDTKTDKNNTKKEQQPYQIQSSSLLSKKENMDEDLSSFSSQEVANVFSKTWNVDSQKDAYREASSQDKNSKNASSSPKNERKTVGYNKDDILKMTNFDTIDMEEWNSGRKMDKNSLSPSRDDDKVLTEYKPSTGKQRRARSQTRMEFSSDSDTIEKNITKNNELSMQKGRTSVEATKDFKNTHFAVNESDVLHPKTSSNRNRIHGQTSQERSIHNENFQMSSSLQNQWRDDNSKQDYQLLRNRNDTSFPLYEGNDTFAKEMKTKEMSTLTFELGTTKMKIEEKERMIASLEKQIQEYTKGKDDRIHQHATEMEKLRMQLEIKSKENDSFVMKISNLEKMLEETRKVLHQEEMKRADLDCEFSRKLLSAAEESTKAQSTQNERYITWQNKQDEFIKSLSEKHAEEIQRMKDHHIKELNSIKEVLNDGKVLHSAFEKLQESTTILKAFESRWKTIKDDSDSRRMNDLGAKEKLLNQMEKNLREDQQRSENEVARLQSSIQNLEDVVLKMKTQHSDEETRRKEEHGRLNELQTSLLEERANNFTQINDEKANIAKRWCALDEKERQSQEYISEEKRNLDQEKLELRKNRSEFEAEKVEFLRNLDRKENELKIKEERLVQKAQKVSDENAIFRQKCEAARIELDSAEATRMDIRSHQAKLQADREALTRMGDEVSKMSSMIATKDREADRKLLLAQEFRDEGEKIRKKIRADRDSINKEREKLCKDAKKAETERLNIVYETTKLMQRKDFMGKAESKWEDRDEMKQISKETFDVSKYLCQSSGGFSRDALLSIENQLHQLNLKP